MKGRCVWVVLRSLFVLSLENIRMVRPGSNHRKRNNFVVGFIPMGYARKAAGQPNAWTRSKLTYPSDGDGSFLVKVSYDWWARPI